MFEINKEKIFAISDNVSASSEIFLTLNYEWVCRRILFRVENFKFLGNFFKKF